ncbi:hypothetical protein B0H14DRAFT_2591434 [Mycena olivaceomarginata]|nr:hypothetical protein B0H14DRAFT_2591434 [Mycena olivaceomarginata]
MEEEGMYIDFPWHQLTRYSGTASYGSLSVFAHAPTSSSFGEQLDSPDSRIPRLRYGALGFDSSSDFLDDLELPALERLALSCDSTGPVASLLYRSAPPLESLEFRFHEPHRSTSRLVDVLNAAPALTRLVIWNGARDGMLKYLEVSGFKLGVSIVHMVGSRCVRGRAVSGIQVPESDVDPLESLSVMELPVNTDPALLFRLREIEMRSIQSAPGLKTEDMFQAYWRTAESALAAALKDKLTKSIILEFKMIAGVSSGMNHLGIQGISLASLGVENFDIFLDINDRFLISINPSMSTIMDVDEPEDDTRFWDVFNALCQKVLRSANRVLHDENIERNAVILEPTSHEEGRHEALVDVV